MSACQFLPTAFEWSLVMNSVCCFFVFFFGRGCGWGAPAVCKSVFCLFQNNLEGLYTLVQPLKNLPAGVVLFSPGSRFSPEGKFIELPQSRCPSILSATVIGIFLYPPTHPFPLFLCSMHILSPFAHFLIHLPFWSGHITFL